MNTSNYDILRQNVDIEGPSPDEIALLRASKDYCDFMFKGSSIDEIFIMSKKEDDINLKLLLINKFDS